MVVVIEGGCAKLCAGRVVLVEKIVHLYEELNAIRDLVPRPELGDSVSGRLARSVVENAIRSIQIVFIATREGGANSQKSSSAVNFEDGLY